MTVELAATAETEEEELEPSELASFGEEAKLSLHLTRLRDIDCNQFSCLNTVHFKHAILNIIYMIIYMVLIKYDTSFSKFL